MTPLGEWIDLAPWRSRLLLIIRITADGMEGFNTLGGKREALASDGTLIAVWPGQYSSTARRFEPGDAAKVAEQLG
jgi:hypothetical protein